ncbi:acetoin biosynthesis transcriptional regulator AlsR [Niallia taxi]|uniref:acetoin biosynthesis transcriptional regulator AlsR n=1 Tax=Niallia taxi TaxID=2499688 RepID=UPI0011AB03A1|nr:LysR family transcriptional regulator [Niallia taxi]MDE5052688.1 LysR family transcriptional regulator [Niallia taxi]MED3963059.1 LysR family transcriptional regulator [Niallia taxi]
MELRHLQYFKTVAEELHFGRAAAKLNMTQPPLSQQIKQLEEELGFPLFHRSSRAVELTTAGNVFLGQITSVLNQLDRAVDTARHTARGELGKIVVGFVGTATYEILPPAIKEFRAIFPSIEIELRQLSAPNQLTALLNGDIDVGFSHPPVTNCELISRSLKTSECVFAIPKNHHLADKPAISMSDIKNEPIISLSKEAWPSLYEDFIQLCNKNGFHPNIVQESTEYQMVIGLVTAGIGIAVVPDSAKRLFNLDVLYKKFAQEQLTAEWILSYKRENHNPALFHLVHHVLERTDLF